MIANDNLTVAGPNVLWFSFESGKFRDIGALTFSKWYTGGRREIALWLERWKPDILIVDDGLKNVVFRSDAPMAVLSNEFHGCIRHLGSVDTGSGAYKNLEIYRVDWTAYERRKTE